MDFNELNASISDLNSNVSRIDASKVGKVNDATIAGVGITNDMLHVIAINSHNTFNFYAGDQGLHYDHVVDGEVVADVNMPWQ